MLGKINVLIAIYILLLIDNLFCYHSRGMAVVGGSNYQQLPSLIGLFAGGRGCACHVATCQKSLGILAKDIFAKYGLRFL
jgi:hypothetical protein